MAKKSKKKRDITLAGAGAIGGSVVGIPLGVAGQALTIGLGAGIGAVGDLAYAGKFKRKARKHGKKKKTIKKR